MMIKRILPPAAAPMSFWTLCSALISMIAGKNYTKRFVRELTKYFGARRVFLVSSGKASLYIILKSLQESSPQRDEVIIPALTCYSVPSAIVKAGLKVRLCDIDPNTLDYDFDQLRLIFQKKANRILTVVATHLYGSTADVEKIKKITEDYSIPVIEDAAQAMGFLHKGILSGSRGDIGVFSLSRGKAFSTVEGGVILVNNEKFIEPVERFMANLPNYSFLAKIKLFAYAMALVIFMKPTFFWIPKAIPYLKLGETVFDTTFFIGKMSHVQAALALGWDKKLELYNKIRSENSIKWKAFFKTLSKRNKSLFSIAVNSKSYLRFPLIVNDKGIAHNIFLESERLGKGIMHTYPKPICCIEQLDIRSNADDYPHAKRLSETMLTIPVHPFVKDNDFIELTKIFAKPKL